MTTPEDRHQQKPRRPEPWRRRAVITAIWSSAVALALLAAAGVIAWSWRGELPSPVASHWSSAGARPDGFSSLAGFLAPMILVGVGCVVLFAGISVLSGRTASTLRITAAATIWLAGMLACLTVGSLAFQRGLADASRASNPAWFMAVYLLAPLVPAGAAALLVPADQPQPASEQIPVGAPQVPLGDSARAVWLRRTSGGAGTGIGVASILLVVVLAITLRMPGLFALVVVLALVFAAMFAFQVRVDATGITVRSLLGWPRAHIPASEVTRAAVTNVSPFRDFGGWGWRVGRAGTTGIVLRGGEALRVDQTGGRSLVVTVDDAAQGAALLNTTAARARA